MSENKDDFDLEQELQDLKEDVDKLSADVGHLIWKATMGRVENKIARKPFFYMLTAFGAGLTCSTLYKLFRKKK
jgi:hypothetical protein